MAKDKKRPGSMATDEPAKRPRKSSSARRAGGSAPQPAFETGGKLDKNGEKNPGPGPVDNGGGKNLLSKNRLTTMEREMYSQITAMFVKVIDPPAGKRKACLEGLLGKLLGAKFFDFQTLRICSAGAHAVLSRDGNDLSRDDLKKAIRSFKKTATPFRFEGKTVKYDIEVFGSIEKQVVWQIESAAGLDLRKEVGRSVVSRGSTRLLLRTNLVT